MTVRYYPGTYVGVSPKFLPLFYLYKVVGKNVFVIHRDVQPMDLTSVSRSALRDFLNKNLREFVDLTCLSPQATPSKVKLVLATEKEKAKYLKLRLEYAKECVKQVNAKLRREERNHAARIRRLTAQHKAIFNRLLLVKKSSAKTSEILLAKKAQLETQLESAKKNLPTGSEELP